MKHTILLLTLSFYVVVVCKGDDSTNTSMREEISILKSLLTDVNNRLQNVEDKNQILENVNSELKSKLDDINPEVEHLQVGMERLPNSKLDGYGFSWWPVVWWG